MTVYVVVEMFQGIVNDVKVFFSEESASRTEKTWLAEHDINDAIGRECKAQDGTELLVFGRKVEA